MIAESMDDRILVVATKNRHKAGELAALTVHLGRTLSLAEWEERHGRALAEPVEDGDSFEANALIKARFYARATGRPALADDSGLSVAALGGAPGIWSARYGGPGLDDAGRCRLLLNNMDGRFDRRAFFTSVLALARPDGAALSWLGRVDGLITREPRGGQGFGYDPVFFFPPRNATLAQLSAEVKNAVSHRSRAARAFLDDGRRVEKFLDSRESKIADSLLNKSIS